MTKVVSTVPQARFARFGATFPQDWETLYLDYPVPDAELIAACADTDFLFVGSVHAVSARVIQSAPSLKLIHVEGVGFDKVDVAAAQAAGIPVCNNRAVNNISVAEHTVGFMLAALRRIPYADAAMRRESYLELQAAMRRQGIHELSAMRVGLVGMGAIGQEVARLLQPFGCRVSYYDAFRPVPAREQALNVSYLPLDELLRVSDIVSLHLPVLPDTVNLINKARIQTMKPGVVLINTSRGEVVETDALVWALTSGRIACAAIDTLTPEPPPADHPFFTLPPDAAQRLILSPHIAGTTDEAFARMLTRAVAAMQTAVAGKLPPNVVNGVTALK